MIRYRLHKSPPLDIIQNHKNPAHVHISCFFKMHSCSVIASVRMTSEWSPSFSFPTTFRSWFSLKLSRCSMVRYHILNGPAMCRRLLSTYGILFLYESLNVCNKNQQNAHFLVMIKFSYIVSDMFSTTRCSSSGRLVRAVLWYLFVHPYKQSGRWQDVLLETCRRQPFITPTSAE
jgi:hypothetical protein